jgi:2-phospho-L-lactate guanylyltransferase
MKATAIVPVKRFGAAKQRLGDVIDQRARGRLIGAMLEDVLNALGRSRLVERIIVVTGEKRAEQIALRAAQRITLPLEVLREPADHGHSEAAVLGIIRALSLGATCAALLPGDCPLIDAVELDDALSRATDDTVAVIPDRHGTGTNGLILSPPDAIGPAFGPGSRDRHLERARNRGLGAVLEPVSSLGLDLDTPEDLIALRQALAESPGSAPRTAAVLAEMP